MNTYPYTNYQETNLDWILTVGAELRACFEPVEVSGTESYKELVRRGALATIKYADNVHTNNQPIILSIYRVDDINQELYFSSGLFFNDRLDRFDALFVLVDYYGNISVRTLYD